MDTRFEQERHFLKANWELVTSTESDQAKGIPVPPQEAPPSPDDDILPLPPVVDAGGAPLAAMSRLPERARMLSGILHDRKSRRKFSDSPLGMGELAYLAWSCEGVRENRGKFSFRIPASGGARHPLDLYVYAHRIAGLPVGLYRYLPVEHALVLDRPGDDSAGLDRALRGHFWDAACVFLWAAVPYRSEWRYGKAAQKLVALDAGHSCQNLYLACEALGLGTCAVGAYDQALLDAWMGLDGEDVFAIYAAPVGRPPERSNP